MNALTFWDLKPGTQITAPGNAKNKYTILRTSQKYISLKRVTDGLQHEMETPSLLYWLNREEGKRDEQLKLF